MTEVVELIPPVFQLDGNEDILGSSFFSLWCVSSLERFAIALCSDSKEPLGYMVFKQTGRQQVFNGIIHRHFGLCELLPRGAQVQCQLAFLMCVATPFAPIPLANQVTHAFPQLRDGQIFRI